VRKFSVEFPDVEFVASDDAPCFFSEAPDYTIRPATAPWRG